MKFLSKEEKENFIKNLNMPVSEKINEVAKMLEFYIKIHPEYIYKPFVKSFKSWEEYNKWRKKQKNPFLR